MSPMGTASTPPPGLGVLGGVSCTHVKPLLWAMGVQDSVESVSITWGQGRVTGGVVAGSLWGEGRGVAGHLGVPRCVPNAPTLPKSWTSKRSKAPKRRCLGSPNLSAQAVRKVRMFLRHRNCGATRHRHPIVTPIVTSTPTATATPPRTFSAAFCHCHAIVTSVVAVTPHWPHGHGHQPGCCAMVIVTPMVAVTINVTPIVPINSAVTITLLSPSPPLSPSRPPPPSLPLTPPLSLSLSPSPPLAPAPQNPLPGAILSLLPAPGGFSPPVPPVTSEGGGRCPGGARRGAGGR